MGIFDDAKSIIIGGKEVASITIDGGTIYEQPVTTRDIGFTVTDGTNALSSVTVSVASKTGTTDGSGECTISEVEDGTYTVTYTKTGYVTVTNEITVDSTHTSFSATMEAETPTRSLEFTSYIDGNPPQITSGVTVTIGGKTCTTGMGVCTISGIADGTYTVEYSYNSNTYSKSITVDATHTDFDLIVQDTTQQ